MAQGTGLSLVFFSTYFYPLAAFSSSAAAGFWLLAADFLAELQVLWQKEANSTCCLRRHMFVVVVVIAAYVMWLWYAIYLFAVSIM